MKLKLTIVAMLLFFILFTSFISTIPNVAAQDQTLFNDDFTKDKSLDPNLWVKNGQLGYYVYHAVESVILNSGGPYFTLVDSTPTFSTAGMGINAANELFTMTTIESTNTFSAPFTLHASVSASQGGGAAFAIWLNGQVGFSGILNPTAPKYGIWGDHPGKWFNEKIVASPQLNTVYDLTITVDSSGIPTLTVASGGQNLGSVVEQTLGTGSLKILIGQYEFWDQDTGIGSNQAYWKSISVTGPQNQTPPPTSSITPTDILTPPPNSNPSQITQTTETPTPITSNSTTSTITPSPAAQPSNITTGPSLASIPLETILIMVVAIPSSMIIAFFIIQIRKKKSPKKTTNSEITLEKPARNWLLIPLMIAGFSTGVTNGIVSLFLVDIARNFYGSVTSTSTGMVSQLSTVNSGISIIATLAIGILVIRFRHKFLFLTGAILIVISAIGGYLAPDLLTLQFFYALEGIGTVVIGIISAVLIVESLAPEKQGKTISLLFAVGALSALIITPILTYITEIGNWRSGLIVLTLPLSLIGLVLSAIMIPNRQNKINTAPKTTPYFDAFRKIAKNKSALSCLIANLFTVAGTQVAIFAIAFYRVQFDAPRPITGLITETALILFFIAPLASGILIDRYGAKRIALITTLLAAIFTLTFFFVPILWLAITLDMMHVWFAGMAGPAFAVLILRQIPKYRGTLFSLNSFFNYAGNTIAAALGGLMLVVSSGIYGSIGIVLGSMTIMGCLLLVFLVKRNKRRK